MTSRGAAEFRDSIFSCSRPCNPGSPPAVEPLCKHRLNLSQQQHPPKRQLLQSVLRLQGRTAKLRHFRSREQKRSCERCEPTGTSSHHSSAASPHAAAPSPKKYEPRFLAVRASKVSKPGFVYSISVSFNLKPTSLQPGASSRRRQLSFSHRRPRRPQA